MASSEEHIAASTTDIDQSDSVLSCLRRSLLPPLPFSLILFTLLNQVEDPEGCIRFQTYEGLQE
ncbi:hypothetical protein ACS0TY_030475 [Phlomoides rotata]